ncbi:MAG TPA: DUF4465 domain-containing protein [Chitinophagaceae bacterium]|nr:MAG: hypothetical protein UZ11_BCD004000140 [Bacteroidetes bacterium OLB11]HMN33526.1 DUF4465 domain-containing protein [Chitinophagaceae bacterium]
MKKMTLFFLAFFSIKASFSQTITFEEQSPFLDSIGSNYFKGFPGIPGDFSFESNTCIFTSSHDTSIWGDYWSGWALSRLKDSVSISYDTSDCAAFPAIGANNSNIYATAFYNSFDPYYNRIRFTQPFKNISSIYITNITIAYRSMENGDGFAKKFGGASGNDPDFFSVTFYGWLNGNPTDSVTAYLADFRDSNNVNDYIVKDWKLVDLSAIGAIDSLAFFMESSDTSAFGMNTPAYFSVDNITFTPTLTEDVAKDLKVSIYPNPVLNQLFIQNNEDENLMVSIYNISGTLINNWKVEKWNTQSINTSSFAKGIYLLKLQTSKEISYQKILK